MAKKRTPANAQEKITAIEKGIESMFSAEHLGNLLQRKGKLSPQNIRDTPWFFYFNNPTGHMVCIFDPQDAAQLGLRIMKYVLCPNLADIFRAAEAEGRDPNEKGLEVKIARDEVARSYYKELYHLLHKHFRPVFEDATQRLIEELLEVIIRELEGPAGFRFRQPRDKYLEEFNHFSAERNKS